MSPRHNQQQQQKQCPRTGGVDKVRVSVCYIWDLRLYSFHVRVWERERGREREREREIGSKTEYLTYNHETLLAMENYWLSIYILFV